MKALVISERPEIIDFVTPLLKDKGYDLIHYKWIIKALDNIEEIQPDVIVLSAREYPRHWKTLAGFVQSGIGGNDVKMYLYDTEPLSQDDSKKAEDLGILSFEKAFKSKSKNVEIALNEPGQGAFQFYHGKWFYGLNPDYVEFDADYTEAAEELLNSGSVKYVTIFDGNDVLSFSANIKKENQAIRLYVKKQL